MTDLDYADKLTATGFAIPNAVVLPKSNAKKIYGIDPVIITPDDLTSKQAYLQLAISHSPHLEMRDFVEEDLFWKYNFISLGLLDFPVVFIGGEPMAGKSLFLAWLTRKLLMLFGKKPTLDWTPAEPKYFGKYNYLYDESFQEQIINEFNRLHRLEEETKKPIPEEELKKFVLYKSFVSLDEADGYAHRQMQSNLTKVIGMVLRRRRHVFSGVGMVMIDPTEFAPVVLKQVTHTATCYWEGHYPNTTSVLVEDVRKGGRGIAKWIWLNPDDWTHLWNSHNIPAMTHEHDIHYGAKRKSKSKEEMN